MKTTAFFVFLCLIISLSYGQVLSADNLLSLARVPVSKMKGHLSKKGFVFTSRQQLEDTVLSNYCYRKTMDKEADKSDTAVRYIYRADLKESFTITYETSSLQEYLLIMEQFRKTGFVCKETADSFLTKPLLFQYHNNSIRTCNTIKEGVQKYALQVQTKLFPNPKDIYYADDLLAFSSHEYLEYYFGKNNVKSDLYYFSSNEIARCSVLFLNTRRQVVFIWRDEGNRCTIDRLIFGGQQKLESSLNSNRFIAENSWVFKSGIRPGMSLLELRRLHGKDFNFYGSNSINAGTIMADSAGKLDFNKEGIILSCMNCSNSHFSASALLSADEAIADERILFVLSISLNAN